MFYFLVSNLTTLISLEIERDQKLNKKLYTLFTLDMKYKFPKILMEKAEQFINDEESTTENLKNFSKNFGKIVKMHLDYYYYNPTLRKFPFFKNLDRNIIAKVGKNIETSIYVKSKFKIKLTI